MERLARARGYLVDLDGTLVSGSTVLPGAEALVEMFGDRLVLVSNNAEHVPQQLARRLARLKLRLPAERIVLAGTAALDIIAHERPGARLLLLASQALSTYAQRAGLKIVTSDPDVVFLARDRSFTYAKLEAAANAVRAGAQLVVANPDRVHPGVSGRVVPETGALLQALLACTGPVPARFVGKPEPALFKAGLAILGVEAEYAVMIGDNAATDGAGAERLGIRYIPVERAMQAIGAALPSRSMLLAAGAVPMAV